MHWNSGKGVSRCAGSAFLNDRLDAGVNFSVARGYTGQTTQNFYPSDIQEVVGVRIPSYASISLTYRFGRAR